MLQIKFCAIKFALLWYIFFISYGNQVVCVCLYKHNQKILSDWQLHIYFRKMRSISSAFFSGVNILLFIRKSQWYSNLHCNSFIMLIEYTKALYNMNIQYGFIFFIFFKIISTTRYTLWQRNPCHIKDLSLSILFILRGHHWSLNSSLSVCSSKNRVEHLNMGGALLWWKKPCVHPFEFGQLLEFCNLR